MRNIFLLLFGFILLLTMAACEKEYAGNTADEVEDPDDYIIDTAAMAHIIFHNNLIISDSPSAIIKGSDVVITSPGVYNLKGTLDNGQVKIELAEEGTAKLIFEGVNISCDYGAPVFIGKNGKTIITLKESTTSTITGTANASPDETGGALFSNSYMAFTGTGSLIVNSSACDGISGDDGVIINDGTFTINSADDGIRGKDYLVIRKGNYSINSKGDGLKSDNDHGHIDIVNGSFNIIASAGDAIDAANDITIDDGFFNIKTGNGAVITENSSMPGRPGSGSGGYSGAVSEKAFKATGKIKITKGTFIIDAADDAIHSDSEVEVSAGDFSIASGDDAIHAGVSFTFDEGNLNVSKSYEGIESALITVNSGTIKISSSDDTFNATKGQATEWDDGSKITINGGDMVLSGSKGDGLDSNGSVIIKGGTVLIHGPSSQPEVGFDINGTFNIDGGYFLASGPNSGNMIEVPSTTSAQNSVIFTCSSMFSSTSLIHLQDDSGNDLFTFRPVRNAYYVVFSSPSLKIGNAYSIYTGGTSTGTVENGLYSGGEYAPGVLKKTFTLQSLRTAVQF
jgi:hypothetical protein